MIENLEIRWCYFSWEHFEEVNVVICNLIVHIAEFGHSETGNHSMRQYIIYRRLSIQIRQHNSKKTQYSIDDFFISGGAEYIK